MDLPQRKRETDMVKEHPVITKSEVENSIEELKQHQPVGLGGKNPHTIKPPPPLPKFDIVRSAKHRFRISGKLNLQAAAEKGLSGKVIITGKKGKMIKITNTTKPK